MNEKKYTFGWTAGLALFLGMVIPTALVSVINVVAMFLFKKNYQYDDWFMVLGNAAGFLGAIFAFDYYIVRPQTGKKLNFNFSPTNFVTYLLVFPMMFGMMLIAEFITGKIPITGPFFGKFYEVFSKLMEQMTADTPTMILLTVVMAPIFEEIIFRGIIQKGLINKGVAPWKAILFASVVFGIVHANPWQFVGAVLLGIVLGLVYFKTRSLLLPMFLHAFNNLCSCLMILFAKTESFADAFNVSEWLLLLAGAVIFGTFYYLFMKKYRVIYS